MKYLYSITVVVIFSLLSCTESKPVENAEVIPELTLEERVRINTQKYCNCAKDLNEFVESIDVSTADTAEMAKYRKLQEEFRVCFDPKGEIAKFGKSLSPENQEKRITLFYKFREEICPKIIPM